MPLEVREIQQQNAEGEEIVHFLLDCQLTSHRAVSVTKELKSKKSAPGTTSPTRLNVIYNVDDQIFGAFVSGEAFGRSLLNHQLKVGGSLA